MKYYISIVFFCLVFATASMASFKDPTVPLLRGDESVVSTEAKNSFPSITLQSILFGSDTRIAVINNQHFFEGDLVNGLLVKKIYKDYVLIRYSGKNKVLKFSKKLFLKSKDKGNI